MGQRVNLGEKDKERRGDAVLRKDESPPVRPIC